VKDVTFHHGGASEARLRSDESCLLEEVQRLDATHEQREAVKGVFLGSVASAAG
jgi:hypothetical protein